MAETEGVIKFNLTFRTEKLEQSWKGNDGERAGQHDGNPLRLGGRAARDEPHWMV